MWVTACMTLLVASLWLASGSCWIYLSDGTRLTVYIAGGVATFEDNRGTGMRATNVAYGAKPFGMFDRQWPSFRPFHLWFRDRNSTSVPLSVISGAFFVPWLVLFVTTRKRIPPGHCKRCGYNLTGNTSGTCPECGTTTHEVDTKSNLADNPS